MIARGAVLEIKQVRPGDENLPPPNGLYSTVRLIGDSSPVDSDASAYFTDDPTDDNYLIANQYRDNWASWSIQFFRNGSADAATRSRVWLRSVLGARYGDERGMIVIRIGQVRNLTDLFRGPL